MISAGDKAPDFSLASDDGSTVSLSGLRGGYAVVYFYPRDDTPGCTVEAKDFSAALGKFQKAGATVVGISKDSIASHTKFKGKYGLKLQLLSDPELVTHRAYGAWGEKTMYGKKVEGVIRSTFLVGPDGKVKRAWPTVKVAGHVDAVLAELTGNGAAPAVKKAPPAAKPAPAKKLAAKPTATKPAPAAKKPAPAAKKTAAAAKKPAAKKTTSKKKT